MKNREEIYPDWKFPVAMKGQNWYNIRTPIQQHGEQTLSKQARTDGKIKSFSANANAVSNRSYQAKNLGSLRKMCNLPNKLNFYKQIRPSHILGSGDMVFKVINTFKNTTSIRSIRFWEKRHFATSVLVLQCLLRLLIIFSYYMKREKIFARIFSKVESLPQRKSFIIRSREITSNCF